MSLIRQPEINWWLIVENISGDWHLVAISFHYLSGYGRLSKSEKAAKND